MNARDLLASHELLPGFLGKGGMGSIRPVFIGNLRFVPISRRVDYRAVAQDIVCVLVGDVVHFAVLVSDTDAVESVHTAAVEGHVSFHSFVKVVFLSIAGVGIPVAEGEVAPVGGSGRNGLFPRLNDLDRVDLTGGVLQGGILVGHGDGLALGVGDVDFVIEHTAGVHGFAAELSALLQGQTGVVCAAGDMAVRADGAIEAAAGEVAPKVFIIVPISQSIV